MGKYIPAELKVNDLVMVRPDADTNTGTRHSFARGMLKYRGKKYRIARVFAVESDEDFASYYLKDETGTILSDHFELFRWHFSREMLIKIKESKKK